MPTALSKKLADEILIFSKRKQTLLTLKKLYDFGCEDSPETLLRAGQFLHHELPIRLARMTRLLEDLPFGLAQMPSVGKMHEWYVQSFQDVTEFAHPQNEADLKALGKVLDRIKNRHRTVLTTMAHGLMELRQTGGTADASGEIQRRLDQFYMTRIGVRMLIGQYVALTRSRRPGWVGVICSETHPADIAREAAHQAQTICRMTYGVAPAVEVVGRTDLVFTYVPTHLHHMLIELIKNSVRAVVEHHGTEGRLPPVRIVVADGCEDVAIKIEDEGGGIPRSGVSRIWTYMYSTAPAPPNREFNTDFDPLAGYGFGLPITRLYARYFGGDLQIISMEGYGTDAYLHLNRLGTHEEVLP